MSATTGTTPRRRLSPDERRDQLIALGVAALADRGLDELGPAEIAERAGVSRTLFFHYFGSVTGFQLAVVTAARDGMLHATEPRPDLPPRERLHDTLARTLGFVHAHDGTFYSLVRGSAAGDPLTRRAVEEARDTQTQRVIVLFEELGIEITPAFAIAMRGWLAFTEQVLVDAAHGGALDDTAILDLLIGTLEATAARLDPRAAAIAR
ncbi:TetR/AcrR family transcriptional regulator [Agromyces seonyuensis]|uniref:TetR family transcriptional regulator n=1 Tax=Agromyces seonyuensis TaxID=2662446 RepID=A0A6I4NZ70_9MICO|nr:TetR/AcrR family transcriptional regulator [Agromyces seonyuensis]MWB99630.1 TetR family transcriptional regulator [Agromyces seonyuensis]